MPAQSVKYSLLLDFLKFIIHPSANAAELNFNKLNKFWNIIRLMSWSILVAIPLSILLNLILILIGYEGSNSIDEFAKGGLPFLLLFLGTVVAPITEELAFRLPLRFRPIYIAISSFFICRLFVGLFLKFIEHNLIIWWILNVSIPFIIAIVIYLVVRIKPIQNAISRFYNNYFFILFYLFSFTFGFIHIFNFTDLKSVILLILILTLPQTIVGIVLGFIRIRFGFIYGVVYHAIYNSLLLTPFVFIVKGTESQINLIIGAVLFIPFLLMMLLGLITLIMEFIILFPKIRAKLNF